MDILVGVLVFLNIVMLGALGILYSDFNYFIEQRIKKIETQVLKDKIVEKFTDMIVQKYKNNLEDSVLSAFNKYGKYDKVDQYIQRYADEYIRNLVDQTTHNRLLELTDDLAKKYTLASFEDELKNIFAKKLSEDIKANLIEKKYY